MSNRTLIEINHDYDGCLDDGFLPALHRYLRSASRETADDLERYGVRVIGMRHHSGKFILDGEPDGFPVQYLPRANVAPAVGAKKRRSPPDGPGA